MAASAFDAPYEPAEKIPSLPTGKTPEHFIRRVQRLLQTWQQAETQAELAAARIDTSRKPRLDGLHFVQIDEFYPIEPSSQGRHCKVSGERQVRSI